MRPSGRELTKCATFLSKQAFTKHAEGSCLIKVGDTHVLCTASLTTAFRPLSKGPALAGSPPNTECCPAPPTHACDARPQPGKQGGAPWKSSA